jgi:hypothetical protein
MAAFAKRRLFAEGAVGAHGTLRVELHDDDLVAPREAP